MEQGGNMHIVMPLSDMAPEVEVLPPPSLYEAYANTEITHRGITATITDLMDMCPIPKDDPRLTAEAIERYTANILTLAGIDIPERFTQHTPQQEQAAKRVEKQKDEARDSSEQSILNDKPKAVVSCGKLLQPETRPRAEAPTPVIVERMYEPIAPGASLASPTVVAPLAEQVHLPKSDNSELPPILRDQEVVHQILPQTQTEAVAEIITSERPMPVDQVERLIIEASVEPISATTELLPNEVMLPVVAEASPTDMLHIVKPPEFAVEPTAEMNTAEMDAPPIVLHTIELPSIIRPMETHVIMEMSSELPANMPLDRPDTHKEAPLVVEDALIAQQTWTLEVANTPPEAVFDIFTQALLEAVTSSEHSETQRRDYDPDVLEFSDGLLEQHSESANAPTQPVAAELADALLALKPEEKAPILPVVQAVAVAVQDIKLLELAGGTKEEVAEASEHLAELGEQLFEAVGIEADDEKISQLLQVLLGADFMSAPDNVMATDIENAGTHEIKRTFPRLITSFTNWAQTPVHSVVGVCALALDLRAGSGPAR
jgi:hypothetical protein